MMVLTTVPVVMATILCVHGLIVTPEGPQVETTNGWLEGSWKVARGGRTYAAFEGIPFATVLNRYDPPSPHENWDGMREAKTPGPLCPQLNFNENGTAPIGPDLATLFWIHGGGHMSLGGSLHGAKYLMTEEIIYITINYRLGNFGFLSFGGGIESHEKISPITENNGLRDIILALQWVQNNLVQFNGNPERVTIAGESSGASAVHALILSPSAKDLFSKAIAQSSTMFQPGATQAHPEVSTMRLAQAVNFTADNEIEYDPDQILACLRSKSTRQLVEADQQIMNGAVLPFHPTIERLEPPNGIFRVLPDTPYNLITKYAANNSVPHVPLILGCTQNEEIGGAVGILLNPDLTAEFNSNWVESISQRLGLPAVLGIAENATGEIAEEMRIKYFENDPVSNQTLNQLESLLSDYYCQWGTRKTAILHAIEGNPNIYHYVLSFPGNYSILNFLGVPTQGVAHSDDLQYLFEYTEEPQMWPNLAENSLDNEFSINLVHTWATFVKTGIPLSWGETWLPIEMSDSASSGAQIRHLNLTTVPHVGEGSQEFLSRMQFWENVFNVTEEV